MYYGENVLTFALNFNKTYTVMPLHFEENTQNTRVFSSRITVFIADLTLLYDSALFTDNM